MTRINCVPPSWLLDQHLVAEACKELPRVYAPARALERETVPHYRMGRGHVLFFYERIAFVIDRHCELLAECRRRGFRPSYEPPSLAIFPPWLRGSWEPDREALRTNLERLVERQAAKPGFYRLCGEPAPADHYPRLYDELLEAAA